MQSPLSSIAGKRHLKRDSAHLPSLEAPAALPSALRSFVLPEPDEKATTRGWPAQSSSCFGRRMGGPLARQLHIVQ